MTKKIQLHNTVTDFLIFTTDAKENGIEVRVQDGEIWLTQKSIAELFSIDRSVVAKHIQNIFGSGELEENSACAIFAQTADNEKICTTRCTV